MFFRTLGLISLSVSLTACNISGSAQKGPFKAGSNISTSQLDVNASPISSTTLTTQVTGSQGDFDVRRIEWDGWTGLVATGQYFDEFQNTDSDTALSLNAITFKNYRFDSANINLFTHLAAARIRQRVSNGQNRYAAWQNTQTELKQQFSLQRVSTNINRGVEQLDLLRGNGVYRQDNANLLLFTGAFLATAGDEASLQSLTEDFADDAQFNGVGANIFNNIAIKAGEDGLLTQVSNALRANGARNPPNTGDMSSLPSWVNTDVVELDTVPPVITVTGEETITLEQNTPYIDEGATAVDDIDGEVASTAVNESNLIDTSVLGEYTVTYEATDIAGNTSTATRTVIIVEGADNEAPSLNLLGDNPDQVEVDTTGNTTYTDPGYEATDNRDEVVSVTIDGQVDTSNLGANTLTYTAIDAAGNSSIEERIVNVVDTTPPVITLEGENPQQLFVDSEGLYEDLGALVSDNYNAELPFEVDLSSVDTTQAGTYTITYTAQDSSENEAEPVSRTVIVSEVPDTTAPVITIGSNTVSLIVGTAFIEDVNATDDKDGDITADIVTTGTVNTNTIGTYTLTYNVADAAGNAATTVTRTVVITEAPDTTAPVITIGSANLELVEGTAFEEDVTANDNKDGDITANIVITGSVDTDTIGTYTLTYNVSDAAGNAAAAVTRTVVITEAPDTTAPVITIGSANLELVEGTAFEEDVTANDNKDGDITANIVITGTVNTDTVGTYTLTYNVSDAAGNAAATVTRTVVITEAPDTTAPVIIIGSANLELVEGTAFEEDVTANDNKDDDITANIVITGSVDTDTVGTYTLIYNVSDAAGNAATTVTRTLVITEAPDTTAPVITIGSANLELVEGTAFEEDVTAIDNKDGDITAGIEITGSVDTDTVGVYTLTYNVSDDAGNAAVTVTRTITVNASRVIPELSQAQIEDYLAVINTARSEARICGALGEFPAARALTWSNQLYQAAYEHSQDMANTIEFDAFSHSGSNTLNDWTGSDIGRASALADRVATYNYDWQALSENIAAGTTRDTAQEAIDAWLASDGHCANLMSTSVVEVGMALASNSNSLYTHYWTQNFGKPVGYVDTATIDVRVTSADGTVLRGVTLSTSESTNQSGTDGVASLSLAPDQEFVLTLNKNGYATQVSPIKSPLAGETINLDITMIERGEVQTFDAETGGVITGANGASVTIAPNSFVIGDGIRVTGDIEVTITPVNVSNPASLASFPGEFTGTQLDGSDTAIISFGTVEYKFSQNGVEVRLDETTDATADILIPIYMSTYQNGSDIQVGDQIPLWYLDERTGIWEQESVATRSVDAGFGIVVESSSSPTGLALSATVSHFTWWNCDVSMETGNANITVTGITTGTAIVSANVNSCDIGWRPSAVDTLLNLGQTSQALFIPSNCEVCYSAEVTYINGIVASTNQFCATAGNNEQVDISLEAAAEGPLDIAANNDDGPIEITALVGYPIERIRLGSRSLENSVTYSISNANDPLPDGVSLSFLNDFTAEIAGIADTEGTFNVVIDAVDETGLETDSVTINFTVIDPVSAEAPLFLTNPSELDFAFDYNSSEYYDLNAYNLGGEITEWGLAPDFELPDWLNLTEEGILTSSLGFDTPVNTWTTTLRANNGAGFADITVNVCVGFICPDTTPIPNDFALSVNDAFASFAFEQLELVFEISLSQAANEDITFSYATSDGVIDTGLDFPVDPAIAGVDYEETSGTITIPAGEESVFINVPLIFSNPSSFSKTLGFTISNNSSGRIERSTATGTIDFLFGVN